MRVLELQGSLKHLGGLGRDPSADVTLIVEELI